MTEVAKGSNRVRGKKNYSHPSLIETGDSPAYGNTPNGLGGANVTRKHISRPSLLEKEPHPKYQKKKEKATKGGASFKGGTTTKTIKGK